MRFSPCNICGYFNHTKMLCHNALPCDYMECLNRCKELEKNQNQLIKNQDKLLEVNSKIQKELTTVVSHNRSLRKLINNIYENYYINLFDKYNDLLKAYKNKGKESRKRRIPLEDVDIKRIREMKSKGKSNDYIFKILENENKKISLSTLYRILEHGYFENEKRGGTEKKFNKIKRKNKPETDNYEVPLIIFNTISYITNINNQVYDNRSSTTLNDNRTQQAVLFHPQNNNQQNLMDMDIEELETEPKSIEFQEAVTLLNPVLLDD